MDGPRFRCRVISPDGVSRRVGGQGLLIGRDPACDIIVADPSVSRRHALIRASFDGVELVPLGRLPVGHNGRPCERAKLLADGDRIEVAGFAFTAKVELPRPARAHTGYRLVRGRSSFALSHTPFVAGGGDTDDLILERWPAGALRFHLAQGELFVEVATGTATRNGAPLEAVPSRGPGRRAARSPEHLPGPRARRGRRHTAELGCGFCASSGKCEALGGPTSSAESSCSGSSFAASPGSCKGFCAGRSGSCTDCASQPGCGWCNSGQPQCVETSPDTGQQLSGSCPYADWSATPDYCSQ